MMSPEGKQRIQLALLVALVVAGVRAGYIFYQRHEDKVAAEKQKQAQNVGYSNPDYYVVPKKLYPYDLKTAKQITLQPVWAKEGYRYTYYRYDPASKRVDFDHEAGLLLPIEKLAIKDVVTAVPSGAGQRRQVMGAGHFVGCGFSLEMRDSPTDRAAGEADEMFFIEDPRDLYKHWSADVWQSVEQHEVKPGMNEMQADFAIGMGVPDAGDTSYSKTVRYPNGGKPLVIEYHDGKAADIKPGT